MKILPTQFFLQQLGSLSPESRALIRKKLILLKVNPTRNKSIRGDVNLFRIRFSDRKKEKRLIYQIKDDEIRLLCILDREKAYRDLEKYLLQDRKYRLSIEEPLQSYAL